MVKAALTQQFLEDRLPISKCPEKKTQQTCVKTYHRGTLLQADTETVFDFAKTCFLVGGYLLGPAQVCVVFNNVWRSKVSEVICINCSK